MLRGARQGDGVRVRSAEVIALLYRAADALRRRVLRGQPRPPGRRPGAPLPARAAAARWWRATTGRGPGAGEIDLVAWHGETLVFVEVKTRASAEFGAPERAVDAEKQRTPRSAPPATTRAAPASSGSRPASTSSASCWTSPAHRMDPRRVSVRQPSPCASREAGEWPPARVPCGANGVARFGVRRPVSTTQVNSATVKKRQYDCGGAIESKGNWSLGHIPRGETMRRIVISSLLSAVLALPAELPVRQVVLYKHGRRILRALGHAGSGRIGAPRFQRVGHERRPEVAHHRREGRRQRSPACATIPWTR